MANIREGARRLGIVGNWSMAIALAVFVLSLIVRSPIGILALPWMPIGFFIRAAAWVLDGFAQ